MIVGVKRLSGEVFEVELDQNCTVRSLKRRISEMYGDLPMERQHILYSGRILKNDLTITDIGIRQGSRLVVMVPSQQAVTQQEIASVPDTPAIVEQISLEMDSADGGVSVTDGNIPESQAAHPESAIGSEADIENLCALGAFERVDVVHCLELAFGDPNRAFEYLSEGIPAHLQRAPGTGYRLPPLGHLTLGPTGDRPQREAQAVAADIEAISGADQTQRMQEMHALVEGAEVPNLNTNMDSVASMMQAFNMAVGNAWNSWEVQVEGGWRPWRPGVPFQGRAGEVVTYFLGGHAYSATFSDINSGVQMNLATGTTRPIRRVLPGHAPVNDPAPVPVNPVPGPCGRNALPPLQSNEIEFEVAGWSSFESGQATRSASKTIGDFKFRLLVFPRGTMSTEGLQVSAFVEADMADVADERWMYSRVKYQISLVNQIDYRRSITKVDTFNFTKSAIDRGWHDMLRVVDVSTDAGWLSPGNSLLFRACVRCPLPCSINITSDYRSRKETGCVNLKVNQITHLGAMIQCLVHIPALKKLVCTATFANGDTSAAHAFQALLHELETAEAAVCADHLIHSLAWNEEDIRHNFDPRILLRSFCQSVGSSIPAITQLFEGQIETYIECCDVDFTHSSTEQCFGLRLSIQSDGGHELRNLNESLQTLVAVELLEGDNAYEAEGHGKQRAKKSIRIKRLPPVLLFEIGRTYFDMAKMEPRKSSSRFEFPSELNLSATLSGANSYKLHTVLVHTGKYQQGEYCAFIKPNVEDPERQWLHFTEEAVKPCSEYAAMDANFGGDDILTWNYLSLNPQDRGDAPVKPRSHSACALVYIRIDDAQAD